MGDTSMPSMPATTALARASRSAAGAITSPRFCQGSPATTSSTRSRSSAWRTSTAATRWPMWIGSNVPPSTPSRVMGGARPEARRSGAGEARHDGGEVLERWLLHDPVADPELGAARFELVTDLVDAPDEGQGQLGRFVRAQAEERGNIGE